ncbi:MAG: hypothetical protein UW95_C0019G0023 [Parcubacteria group bacterium GW2011_GWC1_45_14]|nr:MAG: hypothetical protein UW95_C0019G0023 [Parcubacteria group bacterium GW2011_GWC1_45_14]
MSIISYFEEIVKYAQGRSLKIYLVLVNLLLTIFAIWFANVGLLPFAKVSDFAVFVILGLLFAAYRPGWAFLFFVGTIALENINLAPESLGVALRPYQFFAALTVGALLVRAFQKKSPVKFPKMGWADWAVLAFALSGFLSALFAVGKGIAFKQSIVALSFVAIYFLSRAFIQNLSDIKRVLPFFLSSSIVVLIYGIWQNVRFAKGLESFEVMPGRPNATFAEADWLGMFVTFLITILFSIVFYLRDKYPKKEGWKISNFKFLISNKFQIPEFLNAKNLSFLAVFCFNVLLFIVLILTVARSAWLGAVVVSIGFLKMILIDGFWKIGGWKWKKAGYAALGLLASVVIALGIVKLFNLSSFELANRAQSTASGLQEITISCESENSGVPQEIGSVSELGRYGCAHINLEEIETEKAKGNFVSTAVRPDPNVDLRAQIYKKSWNEIKSNPVFGIGWGNIGKILGSDERGASLNASNIFLEVWLGTGIVGLVCLVFVFGSILIKSLQFYYEGGVGEKTAAVFAALGAFAILVPNLFNSGIFLGFLWAYFGIAVSLLNKK